MPTPLFKRLLHVLAVVLLLSAAACGDESHEHGAETHTHQAEEAHAHGEGTHTHEATADTAGTYVDTTNAFFEAEPDSSGEGGDHAHGPDTHTHDDDTPSHQ